MKPVTKRLILSCSLVAMLVSPGVAGAQDERASSPLPMDSSQGSDPGPVPRERGRERFALGVTMGLSLSHFIEEDQSTEITRYVQKPDMTFGLSGVIRVHEWLSIQPDILFVSKGRRTFRNGVLFSTLDVNYIELPLLARIDAPVSARVVPYLLAGPVLGILLKSQNRLESDGSVTDLTDEAKSIDLSGILGAGAKVALAPQHGLTFEARYDRSFTRFLKSEADVKHSVFAFMLGYQYSFSSASP